MGQRHLSCIALVKRGKTIVKVDGWRFCHQHLAQMIETLIESPQKAFVRDWWGSVVDLDNEMEQSSRKSLAEHIANLKAKADRTGVRAKRSRTKSEDG
jgi:hypothetical protein